ncbi:MAG: glycoside hydrolase family 3 C-terminal domain-containing protein [Bifidobacteriaceae bacterium]|jgi:beta-glucosidase|nr:glycoside hydrolase family 3 C-terminal domain-containing protein [Bifidobacteriaceae bacterium]
MNDSGRSHSYKKKGAALLAVAAVAATGFLGGQGSAVAVPGPSSTGVNGVAYPFQDTSLSDDARVEDLISRLTLDEKVALLHQFSGAIIRLGVPQFRTGTEGLHGLSWLGYATVFPQNTGIAMTWNPELAEQIGDVVGSEARAYNSVDARFNGIDIWAPVVDLARDPRAGRASESMGEDAYLAGVMSTEMAAGIQGGEDGYYQAIPTLKHFAAYGQEASRAAYSANASQRNLYEYYYQAFSPAIEAGTANGIMTAYNLINGKPTMTLPEISSVMYDQWIEGGTKGSFFAVTDAASPSNLSGSNAYYPNSAIGQAASMADSLLNGIAVMTSSDTNTPETRREFYEALARGMITEADIDAAIYGILLVRLKAGDLDPDPDANPYKALNKENALDTAASRAVAAQAAQEQVVLLKNEAGILPLAKSADLALVGPLGDENSTDFYAGTYPYTTYIKDSMAAKLTGGGTLAFSRGVDTIALQVTGGSADVDGKFLVTGATASSPLTGTGTSAADPKAQFQLYDYGYNNMLLRSVDTDRYLAARGSGNTLVANADPPGYEGVNRASQQWSTDQNLGIVQASGDVVSLRFVKGTGVAAATAAANVYVSSSSPYNVVHNGNNNSANRSFEMVTVVDGQADAVAKATGADVAVVAVGDQPHMTSRETYDRQTTAPDIKLPPEQEALINAVSAVNPNTVVVIVGSYPFDISDVVANPNVKGIVYTSHAGQELGDAVADVLFGDYAPAGRLNQTWYPGVGVLPTISDYDIIKGDRTYQYYDGSPIYPFGYGLTYTTFAYQSVAVAPASLANPNVSTGTVKVTAVVKNTGTVASDEVVQVYASYDGAAASRIEYPIRRLVGFERVNLVPNETKTLTFDVALDSFAVWDVESGGYVLEPGSYTISAGRSSAAADQLASAKLTVTGAALPARNLSTVTSAELFDDYSFTDVTSTGLRADVIPVSVHEDNSYGINFRKAGGWVQYGRVALGSSSVAISLRASNPNPDAALIEVWRAAPDAAAGGTQVGTVTVSPTGHAQTYVSVGASLTGATGTADLYLVSPTANISVSWLKLGASAGAQDADISVAAYHYNSNVATSLTRARVATPARIEQRSGSLVVEAATAAPKVVTGPVTWSVTDTSGAATTLATVSASGQLTAAGTGDGTVRVVARYPTAAGTASSYLDVELLNQTVAAGTNPEAVIIRSGWDSRPGDITWGPNQFTAFGSIWQHQGTLWLSAQTYPAPTTAARPVTYTVTDQAGNATDLAEIVPGSEGAGFIEGQTSGNNMRAWNATLRATGVGDGEVYVTATTANGLSWTSKIVIQGQETKTAYPVRIEAEVFDAQGNVGGVASNLRADNVHGDDVTLQLNRVRDGDWAVYRNIDLGTADQLDMVLRYVKVSTEPATITVMADDPVNGVKLGELTVTGDRDLTEPQDYLNVVYAWETQTISLAPVSGTHDIYFVFDVSAEIPNTDISSTYGAVAGWLDLGVNWFAIQSVTQVPPTATAATASIGESDGNGTVKQAVLDAVPAADPDVATASLDLEATALGTVTSSDGDAATADAVLRSDGTVTFEASGPGTYSIPVTFYDNLGQSVTVTHTVTVLAVPQASGGAGSVASGGSTTFDAELTGEAVTAVVGAGVPAGASVTATTAGVVTFDAGTAAAGDYSFDVTWTDDAGQTVTVGFDVEVLPVDSPPTEEPTEAPTEEPTGAPSEEPSGAAPSGGATTPGGASPLPVTGSGPLLPMCLIALGLIVAGVVIRSRRVIS